MTYAALTPKCPELLALFRKLVNNTALDGEEGGEVFFFGDLRFFSAVVESRVEGASWRVEPEGSMEGSSFRSPLERSPRFGEARDSREASFSRDGDLTRSLESSAPPEGPSIASFQESFFSRKEVERELPNPLPEAVKLEGVETSFFRQASLISKGCLSARIRLALRNSSSSASLSSSSFVPKPVRGESQPVKEGGASGAH